MKKYSKSFKAFLNRHKRIKRFVYSTHEIGKGTKRVFFILPLVVVLILVHGKVAHRQENYADLPKATGVIRNIELYETTGGKSSHRYLFFIINGEPYYVSLTNSSEHQEWYNGRARRADDYELMKKIENLSDQNTVVTVALSKRKTDLISLLTTVNPVVDIRTKDEIIVNIEIHNNNILGWATFISWTSVIPALIWLIMLLSWLEPLFWCYKYKKPKDSRRNKRSHQSEDGSLIDKNTPR